MSQAGIDLRAVVADVVREMMSQAGPQGIAQGHAAVQEAPGTGLVTPPPLRERVERVRIADDADLDQFVRRLLVLFENPKNRQDLRAGRLRFSLDSAWAQTGSGAAVLPATLVDKGAVTERHVKEAAEQGRGLLLGRRAVLTPLAREKARTLGVPIEKER